MKLLLILGAVLGLSACAGHVPRDCDVPPPPGQPWLSCDYHEGDGGTGRQAAPTPAPGPSGPGPSDPGPSDPGPSDPGPSDPGPSDPGPSDPGKGDGKNQGNASANNGKGGNYGHTGHEDNGRGNGRGRNQD